MPDDTVVRVTEIHAPEGQILRDFNELFGKDLLKLQAARIKYSELSRKPDHYAAGAQWKIMVEVWIPGVYVVCYGVGTINPHDGDSYMLIGAQVIVDNPDFAESEWDAFAERWIERRARLAARYGATEGGQPLCSTANGEYPIMGAQIAILKRPDRQPRLCRTITIVPQLKVIGGTIEKGFPEIWEKSQPSWFIQFQDLAKGDPGHFTRQW